MIWLLFILIALVIFGAPLVSIVLSLGLRKRVERIEAQINRGAAGEEIRPVAQEKAAVPISEKPEEETALEQAPPAKIRPEAVQPETVGPQEVSERPAWFNNFIDWLKEEWLLKLGALLFIIGLGWFVTYAFMNNWIGPRGRIGFGLTLGALVLLFGWWRIKKYLYQGGIFLVLGSTIILITIFAAQQAYQMFTPAIALVIMFLSAAFVALASVKYKARPLSLVSLILAGIAPLLVNISSLDYIGLFAYLLVITAGAIWIVILTGRRELVLAALLLVGLYSLPHLTSGKTAELDILLLFAYGFALLFFLTNILSIVKAKSKGLVIDLLTAALNGLLLLSWIMIAAQKEWQSLILAAWMLAFGLGAFFAFKASGRREPFLAYAGVGAALLAAATSAELEGPALTIAYTLESGLIVSLIYWLFRDIHLAEKTSLLLLGPLILSVESIGSNKWAHSILHDDFFVLLIMGLTLFLSGWLFWRYDEKNRAGKEDGGAFSAAMVLLILGSLYFYILTWLSLHVHLTDYLAVMISLVIYTIVGLASYLYGNINFKKYLKYYGVGLLAFVVGRLLIVDVWQMRLTGRIITFCLVGVLLISTAFLGRRKKQAANSLNKTT